MRIVFALVLLIGLGMAGGAVYLAQQYIGDNREALEKERQARLSQTPRVRVFVAKRRIEYGEKIDKKDVRITTYATDALPDGIFKDPKNLFPEDEIELRSAQKTIEKFEPITRKKVTAPGQLAGVTSALSPGERAFAIKVDLTSGVAGFLRPGNLVDVYWSGKVEGQQITQLIDSSVRLIAIDQNADTDLTRAWVARVITVAVSPIQVAALTQAQQTGRLSLSLVGAGVTEEEVLGQVQVDQKELLGIEDKVVVQAKKKKVCSVRSRKGTEVVSIPIPCPDE